MKKILIPTKLDAVAGQILEQHGGYQVIQEAGIELAELAAAHADTHALIVRSEKVSAEIIDALPELQVVVRAGAGFNTIDTKYARQKGVDVMNTPGANANAVAEEVVAMMLADARHVVAADQTTRAGKWEKKALMGREIAGKTIGIVGLGNIGQLVARRLSGFDVSLLGYDPVISPERAADMNVELVDLETLFSRSDYVTLHVPETDDTRGLVGERLVSLMKDGATIVNCARAGIVDEAAIRAVKEARGLRFLNDVYAKDAEGEKSVADIADLMLPHLGASTHEANYNAARRAAEQLIDLDEKGITSFIVNRDIPDGLDEAYCELANSLARLCRCLTGRKPLKRIETRFYGSLEPFSDWLIVPILAGIWEDFERYTDHRSARDYLKEMGVEHVNRVGDLSKKFENSITVDLTYEMDQETLKRMSVRGTVAEGMIIVSRINEFDRLYFEPRGNAGIFLYEDRPGVVGTIGVKLASDGVNIEDMRHSHDAKKNRSLVILRVNKPISPELLEDIRDEIHAVSAFSLRL